MHIHFKIILYLIIINFIILQVNSKEATNNKNTTNNTNANSNNKNTKTVVNKNTNTNNNDNNNLIQMYQQLQQIIITIM